MWLTYCDPNEQPVYSMHVFPVMNRITLTKTPALSDDPFDKPPCRGCSSYLTEPYIKCAECGPSPFLLCLQVSMHHMCTNVSSVPKSVSVTKVTFCFPVFHKRIWTQEAWERSQIWNNGESKEYRLYSLAWSATLTAHSLFPLSFLTDFRFPRARAGMDGPGGDGSVGGCHGLWLWKLVSALSSVTG